MLCTTVGYLCVSVALFFFLANGRLFSQTRIVLLGTIHAKSLQQDTKGTNGEDMKYVKRRKYPALPHQIAAGHNVRLLKRVPRDHRRRRLTTSGTKMQKKSLKTKSANFDNFRDDR